MNGNSCLPSKEQIANEILAYLTDHPDAKDTLEGIIQWWLLERKIRFQTELLKDVLSELVDTAKIERVRIGSKAYYRLKKQ